MKPDELHAILKDLKDGKKELSEVYATISAPPTHDLGFAQLDIHRSVRCGLPEVIFCPGKTTEQIVKIAGVIHKRCGRVLATRATPEDITALKEKFCELHIEHSEPGRIIHIGEFPEPKTNTHVLVVSAGTGDIPVAEEAVMTARAAGSEVRTLYDVGVAGIHRLLDAHDKLRSANALVVVAGMEGALASVVGGIVNRPVIAVPTSIGYGASFNGVAALLAMLNACAPGISVVNIDNGFGAGFSAALINEGGSKAEAKCCCEGASKKRDE